MMDNDAISNKKKTNDAYFKEFIKNKYMLSTVLMGCTDEFKDLDMEQTLSYLDVEDDCVKVRDRNTRFHTEDDSELVMDSVFYVKSPNNGTIAIIVEIEGQERNNPGYPILNRAIAYASELIHDQKGKEYIGDDYGSLKKVYSIWCMMNPKMKDRNTIVNYRMIGSYNEPYSSRLPIDDPDLMRIVMVNIGGSDGLSREGQSKNTEQMMKILNLMFKEDLNAAVKKKVLNEQYNIPISDSLSEAIRGISMGFVEEFRKGRQESRDEDMYVETLSQVASNLIETTGMTIDEAITNMKVPDEYIPFVKKRVNELRNP